MHLLFLFLLGFVTFPSFVPRFTSSNFLLSSSASALFNSSFERFSCSVVILRQNSLRTYQVQPSSSSFFSRSSLTLSSASPLQNDTTTSFPRPRGGSCVQIFSAKEKYSARDRLFCSNSGKGYFAGNISCSRLKSWAKNPKDGCSSSPSVVSSSDRGARGCWADGGMDSSRGTESGTTTPGSSQWVDKVNCMFALSGPPVD